MIDELATHKRAVASANAAMKALSEAERFDELFRLCSIVQSHMASAGAAVCREDEDLIRVHLGHAREGLILALRLAKTR